MNPTMQQNTNDRCKLNVDPSKYGIKFKPLIQLTEETMKYVDNSWHHATLTKELLIPEEDWRYTEEHYEFEDMLNIIKTYGVKPPKTHNLFWYNSQLQIDCFSNDDELLKFAIKMSKGNNDNETSELDDNLSTDVESTSDEYENDDIDGSSEYDEETDKIELKIKKTENQENTESKSSNVTGNEILDFIIKTVMGNYFCNVNYDENNIVNENENENEI